MPLDPASLEGLHDVIVPAPGPWWPPAPGWLVLGAAALALLLYAIRRGVAARRANAYRREATRQLAELAAELDDGATRARALRALPELVKRVALAALPRARVAPLSGAAWLAWLDRTGATDAFTRGAGRWLPRLGYDPEAAEAIGDDEARELVSSIRRWVEGHRPDGASAGDENPETGSALVRAEAE